MFADTHWEHHHLMENRKWLTGSFLPDYLRWFPTAQISGKRVLEIGCGLCGATQEIFDLADDSWVIDASKTALERASAILGDKVLHYSQAMDLPESYFDTAISLLVTQHLNDQKVIDQIAYALRALKRNGLFHVQFAAKEGITCFEDKGAGTTFRSLEYFYKLVHKAEGRVLYLEEGPTRFQGHPGLIWYCLVIGKNK